MEEINVSAGKGFYFFRDGFGWQQGYSGYEVPDMLLNNAATNFTATGIPGAIPVTDINWENALYAQDDWRVMPNLTLNLGLRWDLLTPYYEKDNKLANYDPITQRLVLPGNGVPRSTLNTNYGDFGPRLGFDYLLNQKTAFRGGYDIFYSLDRGGIGNQLSQNPPALVTQYRFSGPGSNVRLSQPIPLPDPVDPNASTLPPGTGVIYIPRNSKNERIQQWNVGVQREIDSKTSAMLAYLGTRGSNLATVISSPGFGGALPTAVGAIMYIGTSKYDSLQATMRRVESNGLSYFAAYTFGDASNDGPGFFAGNPFMELRVEGFNIFNWAQYNQPGNVLGNPDFGQITGTRLNSERQVQLAARYIF